jgi:hypothetical protein
MRAGLQTSTIELSLRTVELGREFLREIEMAGDSIAVQTTDLRIKRNSLQWKLSCVPAVEEAVLRQDRMIAMIDLTAFRQQVVEFLDSAAGAEAFGTELPFAQRALVRFAPAWDSTAAAIGVHLSDANREKIRAWVRAHPIERVPFTRATIVGETAWLLRDQESSLGAAVGGMQETLDRLELRISLVNEFAIKQASWLAELAELEARSSPEAADLTATMHSTRTLLDETPEMIRGERTAALADVERQRVATLATLAQERAIVLAALSNERAILLASVDEQRRLAMRDVDSLRVRATADAIHVVDHLMLRVAELLAVLVILAGVFLLLLRRRAIA